MQVKGDIMTKDKDIREMAGELGCIKEENLEEGLKKQPKGVKDGITAAYNFMKKSKKK